MINMKKLLILFLILIVSSCATQKQLSRSVPLINVGTSANSGTGESLRAAMIKINLALTELRRIGISGVTADSAEINVLDGLDHNVISILAIPEVPTIFSAAGDTSAYPTPGKVGNIFIDTSSGNVYISIKATRHDGWVKLN